MFVRVGTGNIYRYVRRGKSGNFFKSPFQRAQIILAAYAFRQFYIKRTLPLFFGILFAVQGKGENVFIARENFGRAVSLMRIQINQHGAAYAFFRAQFIYGHGHGLQVTLALGTENRFRESLKHRVFLLR